MNKFIGIGRIANDINYSVTANGTAWARSSIAIDRKNYSSNSKEVITDFIPFIGWGNVAELFKKYTSKGSLIGIEGYVSVSNYKNKNNESVRNVEIVVERLELLESKKSREERMGNTSTINLSFSDTDVNKISNMNPNNTSTYNEDNKKTNETNKYGFITIPDNEDGE